MKKKTFIGISVSGILLSLALAFAVNLQTREHTIQAAAYVDYQDEYLYGVDIGEDTYYLFRTDVKTGYSRVIREPRIQNGRAVTIEHLSVLPGGEAYFHQESRGKDEIRRCDFERGRTEAVWDLSKLTKDMYWYLEEIDGMLLLQTVDANNVCSQWKLDEGDGTWRKEQSNRIEENFDEFFFSEAGLWSVDAPGNIYLSRNGGKPELLMDSGKTSFGLSNCYYGTYGNSLHFYNVDTEKNYVIGEEAGSISVRECETCPDVKAIQEQLGYVTDVKYVADNRVAGYVWTDGISIPFLWGEEIQTFPRLSRSFQDQAKVILVIFILALLAYSGGVLLLYGIYRVNHRKLPLFIQMLFLCVPMLFAVEYLSSTTMNRILMTRFLNMEKENLIESAYQSRLSVNEEILPEEFQPDLDWNGIRDSGEVILISEYYSGEENEIKGIAAYTQTIYYSCRNGEVYPLTEYANKTVPIQYNQGENVYRAIRQAVSVNLPVTLVHQDIDGKWLSVYLVYRDQTGKERAVIELRKNLQLSMEQIAVSIEQVTREIVSWLVVLMGSVVLLLLIGLFPLTRLSHAVEAMARGKLGVRVRVRQGVTEIGRISQVFNEMAENIERSIRELSEAGKKYALFVPPQFFHYLGKENILETERGDYAEKEFLVMRIGSTDFESIALDITGQEAFESIKESLDHMVPILEGCGGMIAGFKNSGVLALYQEEGEALNAAIQTVASMNRAGFVAGRQQLRYTAGMSFGPVRLGMIGAGHRTEASAMSLNCQFASRLQTLAVKYGASVLITGEAAKRTKNFEKGYHYRILGYAYFRSKDVVDVLYDVYDGEDAETRQKKEQTRELFEEGVHLFMSGEFLESRNRFIHVLYKNREDRAARQYFYLCEQYLEEKEQTKNWQYIETF